MSVVLATQAMVFLFWQPELSKRVLHTSKLMPAPKGSLPKEAAGRGYKKSKIANPMSTQEEMV